MDIDIDIERILKDYRIPYDPTVNRGWLNITCPFCGDAGQHGGFNIAGQYYHCWRCGGHSYRSVFYHLLRISAKEYDEWVEQYSGSLTIRARLNKRMPKAQYLQLPGVPLNAMDRMYLKKNRRMDPDFLAEKYLLRSGGIAGRWKYRIIIPLIFRKKIVSWTARDTTGQQKIRYKNLSIEESVIDPKEIFYNLDNATGSRVCVVEGPFDVMRMGDGFICSFGTSVTQAQINYLVRNYKDIFILYDPEKQAMSKAKKFAESLSLVAGVAVWVVDSGFTTDPGDYTENQVQLVRKELGFS